MLPRKVADCITNPDESKKQEAEIWRLQEEVDSLKAKNFLLKEDMAATQKMAEKTQKVAAMVKATFGETGTTIAKAKLLDEDVLRDKKLFVFRMVWILANFAE